jgi:hypothetical protein
VSSPDAPDLDAIEARAAGYTSWDIDIARTNITDLIARVRQLEESGTGKNQRLSAALIELTHHGDLTPSGRRVLERIIGGTNG